MPSGGIESAPWIGVSEKSSGVRRHHLACAALVFLAEACGGTTGHEGLLPARADGRIDTCKAPTASRTGAPIPIPP